MQIFEKLVKKAAEVADPWLLSAILLACTIIIISIMIVFFRNRIEVDRLRKLERELRRASRVNHSILESVPVGMSIFVGNPPKIVDCNDKLIEMFDAPKQHITDRFFEDFSPEYLPDGRLSIIESQKVMNRAINGETVRLEWPHQTAKGVLIPCDITLTRVKNEEEFIGLASIYDLREIKKMSQDLHEHGEMLKALNRVSSVLLEPDGCFEDIMQKAMCIIAETVNVDHICVWENKEKDDSLYFAPVYEWMNRPGRETDGISLADIPFWGNIMPGWQEKLSKGECIGRQVSDMSTEEQTLFVPLNIMSVFVIPVFEHDRFWGAAAFFNYGRERLFAEKEELILRSAIQMIVNAIIRNDMTSNLINTTVQLKAAVEEANEANRLKNVAINTMESILNNIDAFIFISVPSTGEILFINQHMKKALNRENDNLVGEYCYKLLHGFDKICDFCACHKLDKNPERIVVWDDYIKLMNCHIRHSDCYIDWPNGEKVHLQHGVDISVLIHAMEQTEQSNRAKTTFLSHMSHEIRTPMNAILGISEIQLQGKDLSPDTREAFVKIYESGDLLLNIINDILDLSKVESGKLELNPVKYAIPSLINDTAQLNRLRYESKPIQFTVQVDENTPYWLVGDELRIKQVLNNILSNAFKYTDRGMINFSVFAEPEPAVMAENQGCHPEKEYSEDNVTLVFRVNDTGQGMTEEQLGRIFEEYTRFNLDTNRTIVGAGLGISITKRLVDLMNGDIAIESEPGKGTVFTVRIPQKRAGLDVCGPKLIEKLKNAGLKNETIMEKTQFIREYMPYGSVLVVDDVETNLYVAKGMLAPYGVKIETAANAFEAIEKIQNGNIYDIVFMDHMMPQMDGIQATKIIREMGYTYTIIALTANALIGQSQIFLQNGFDGFLSKPIDSRELNLVLNNFIRSKKPSMNEEAVLSERHEQNAINEDSGLKKFFVIDAKNAVNVLGNLADKMHVLCDAEIASYIVTVHGMKSALANVGENELSMVAFKLEQAGEERNFAVMSNETPDFISALQSLIEKFKPAKGNDNDKLSDEESAFLNEKLHNIKKACKAFNKSTIKAELNDLRKKAWPSHIDTVFEEIEIHILHSKFKEVAASADKLTERDLGTEP